jgi:hypothetical protein
MDSEIIKNNVDDLVSLALLLAVYVISFGLLVGISAIIFFFITR